MKPATIHILLHHHLSEAAFPQPSAEYNQAIEELKDEGFLDDRLKTTEKGRLFIDTLTEVSPPEAADRSHITQLARYRKRFYLAVASLIAGDEFLDLTPGRFAGEIMKRTGGTATPAEAQNIYQELLNEALSPKLQKEHFERLAAEKANADAATTRH